ncbi:BspA family leucine-rich repeat surface protein [Carboxylicivirga sp. RSCT41]|uniref:BspA family leucine-rich repeat surface protein n=1 Tax=Carboxylicivirga agarovorans TaxID=3417570 RepID=UPI003D34EB6C
MPKVYLSIIIVLLSGMNLWAQNEFITTWAPDGGSITIPIANGPTTGYNVYKYNIEILNENGSRIKWLPNQTGEFTSDEFAGHSTITIKISGTFPRIYFGGSTTSLKNKLLTIEQWGNIKWNSMDQAFIGCTNLTNNATDAPDLSNVTKLRYMFSGASSFNADLSNWDVSTITDMEGMFKDATSFDGDISNWVVSKNTNFFSMFEGATSFNQDISNWKVNSATIMSHMFTGAISFNSDLSKWEVNRVTTMHSMFFGASSFNQDISSWEISSLSSAAKMLDNSGMSMENYDNLLTAWNQQVEGAKTAGESLGNRNIALGAAGINYCKGASARANLLASNGSQWTINDAGQGCPFITTWTVTDSDKKITIPTSDTGYKFTIDWGDGTVQSLRDGDVFEHTYSAAGTYTVKISGDFPVIYFNNSGDKAKIQTIERWGDIEWSSMAHAFNGCSNLQLNAADAPDLSNVISLRAMFMGCSVIDADISHWDVSNVSDVEYMFYKATAFNNGGQPLSWGNKTSSFQRAGFMFGDAKKFNQDISSWDVSNITLFTAMFYGADDYNNGGQPLTWTTTSATSMDKVFRNAVSFNQDISSWTISKVEFVNEMFLGATVFNQDISSWDVSSVRNMNSMFTTAPAYNNGGQPLNWGSKTASVTSMDNMFSGASGFNQDISAWDISALTTASGMLNNSGMSTTNYDKLLIGWNNQVVASLGTSNEITGVAFSAEGISYCMGKSARTNLLTNGWGDTRIDNSFNSVTNIYDAGEDCSGTFTTTWEVTDADKKITIPHEGLGYNFMVDWGDGTIEQLSDGDAFEHTYSAAGTYTVKISGDFPRIYFGGSTTSLKNKLLTIEQWGDIEWINMAGSFFGCANLTCNATDQPNLSNVTSMRHMFDGATLFEGDLSNWDVSNVTNMYSMFCGARAFTSDLSSWEVNNVTNMASMFYGAHLFTSDLSNWTVSKVTTMSSMFRDAGSFNCDLSKWTVSEVTNMYAMFYGAGQFTSDLSSWNVSKVTTMGYIFCDASSFDSDLSQWKIGSLTNAGNMLDNSGLSSANYDKMLIEWNEQVQDNTANDNVEFSADGIKYCAGTMARKELIDAGWGDGTTGEDGNDGDYLDISDGGSTMPDHLSINDTRITACLNTTLDISKIIEPSILTASGQANITGAYRVVGESTDISDASAFNLSDYSNNSHLKIGFNVSEEYCTQHLSNKGYLHVIVSDTYELNDKEVDVCANTNPLVNLYSLMSYYGNGTWAFKQGTDASGNAITSLPVAAFDNTGDHTLDIRDLAGHINTSGSLQLVFVYKPSAGECLSNASTDEISLTINWDV